MTDFAQYRTDLTSDVAIRLRHDLRTPVNHIVGYTEMLLEDIAPAAAVPRETLGAVLADAREVLDLISRSLRPGEGADAARVESLFAALRLKQKQITGHVQGLMAGEWLPADTSAAEDLERILHAASRLAPAADAAPQQMSATVTESALPATAIPGARLLVVDDDEGNRLVLRRRLERDGHVVVTVDSGEAALQRLALEPFDLVLLDILMPGIDGHEVLVRMKRNRDLSDIPVIMISALDDMPSIVRGIECGAEDYLPKPFDPVLLRARISASLARKRARDNERAYLRQVEQIIAAAIRVEQGTYVPGALSASTRTDRADSELNRLMRVFDGMAATVQSREDRLLAQLRELQHEIGAARTGSDTHLPLDGGALPTGELFAERYHVLGVIGHGGMGSVYHAHDRVLNDDVAIKTLLPELVADERVVSRFKKEVRLARRISHPNVVRTHDLGEWHGVHYITMERVAGITLRALLDARKVLHPASVLAISNQLADSLIAAHREGVIHRDIKPQNLLLDNDGVLKVMDFGVSRIAEQLQERAGQPFDLHTTESGMVLGTPSYMSPEQLLGEPVDARSDLFAVGVVLYECITGRLPFGSDKAHVMIARQLTEQPEPPLHEQPGLPAAFSALVLRLLRPAPDERVQSALELRTLLSQLG